MKRVCAIVLICLLTVSFRPVPAQAQTVHHFVSTVWSQSSPQPVSWAPGYTYQNAYIWRHSITNGGQALIWIDNYTYDDGSYFDHQSSGYISVYDSSWTFVNVDTYWTDVSGYRVDNGNGTTTIYVWTTMQVDGNAPTYSGVMTYVEQNSTLAAGQSTSLQAQMGLIDNDAHGPVSMFGINWKCMILAANDPICDELAVIFGPEAWLPCVLVIYELCVHVEQLPPL